MAVVKPIWLTVAEAFTGLAEIPGKASNPLILRWAADLGAPAYTDDDEPWCALSMNRVMTACGLEASAKRGSYDLLRAKSFANWGIPVEPTLGAVLVFARPEGGHVGLYLGERADAFYVLGGNTRNAVGAAWISKDRLIACRWPNDPPDVGWAKGQKIILKDDGNPVSINEA